MKNKNIITGIVVVISLLLLFLGFNFLNSNNFFVKGNTYYALYNRVDGLEKSSIVIIRGYKVGTVVDVHFKDATARELVVAFTVDDDYKIPRNTEARIVNKDIMGSRSLALIFPDKVEGYVMPRDTLKSSLSKGLKEEVSAQVLPLKAKAEELMSSIDTLLNAAKVVLGAEPQRNIVTSLENINKTFQHLAHTTGNLDMLVVGEQRTLKEIIQNFSQILENLNQNKANINKILSNVSTLTDTLARADFAKTLLNFQGALQELTTTTQKINAGEGTVGALLNDRDLYNHLDEAAANMNRLLTDVRLNPKKYVSFSLLKTGKTIYYDSESKASKEKQSAFRIQILQTTNSIALTNPVFKNYTNVLKSEVEKGKFRYTIGYTSDYKKLQKLLKKVRKDFPDAYIVEDK